LQETRYVKVARLAYQIAKEQLALYSHPRSPHRYTLPQLATCVILTFYLNKSYRDTGQWLLATDKVCSVLGLTTQPCVGHMQHFQRPFWRDFLRVSYRNFQSRKSSSALTRQASEKLRKALLRFQNQKKISLLAKSSLCSWS